MNKKLDRRDFIGNLSMAGASLAIGMPQLSFGTTINDKPALLGGPKAHPTSFPSWPIVEKSDENALLEALQSKKWGRLNGQAVASFEEAYKNLSGAKHCLAVSSGTSALYTAMGALDIGPGDDVIIPVYTFVATYNVVVLNYALPRFVDTDIESFQIEANQIEQAISPQTKVIMPVHIGGSPADLDTILELGKKHDIPIVEDACQAPMAEWRGEKVGTLGLAGAISFQSSKNLTSGEGGALLTNDKEFAESCYDFHNQGRYTFDPNEPYSPTRGTNLRMTEFQGGLLLAQMKRFPQQVNHRWDNAAFLTSLLKEIPGIRPAKLYEGVTKSAYHLYMFRYDKREFQGMDRSKFLEALRAEGIPCSGGYGMLNKEKYVTDLAKNKHYLKIYGEKTMKDWLEQNHCPQNDQLCKEAVWFSQSMLLGTRKDMEQIAQAIQKIMKYAGDLKKA
ncbi:3-amino-5-hydroxybenzoate synthase [Cyclobacterium sediminis]